MSDSKYFMGITFATLICTFIAPWWMIPLSIALISLFYKGSALKASAMSVSAASMIWMLIAGFKDMMATVKASTLVGDIFGHLSTGYVFALTGLTIGIVSGLAAGSGSQLRRYVFSE
ncbi:MAG: hypothetical protein IPN29_11850 [Saprospiraceae bacterium]|nr:hypothetical protein [Saprospiraceae bacterium]